MGMKVPEGWQPPPGSKFRPAVKIDLAKIPEIPKPTIDVIFNPARWLALGRLELTLPWPPTVNTYFTRFKNRTIISRKGKAFRKRVVEIVGRIYSGLPLSGPLNVSIEAFPPDKRTRDIDNLLKATLDSMGKGGVYLDDSQIHDLRICRRSVFKGGKIVVIVEREERKGLSSRRNAGNPT
jgi:crossover junction endodeoxyribonuclease RusA